MRTLRPIMLALLLAVLAFSAGWSAPKAKAPKPAAAAENTTNKTIKGYTTKSGKVVKPYERKAPAKSEAAKPVAPAKGKAMAKAVPEAKEKAVKPHERKAAAPTSSAKAKAGSSEAKTVHVKGYTTKSGKVVQPYERRAPTKH